jgi:hypothetical protein
MEKVFRIPRLECAQRPMICVRAELDMASKDEWVERARLLGTASGPLIGGGIGLYIALTAISPSNIGEVLGLLVACIVLVAGFGFVGYFVGLWAFGPICGFIAGKIYFLMTYKATLPQDR